MISETIIKCICLDKHDANYIIWTNGLKNVFIEKYFAPKM